VELQQIRRAARGAGPEPVGEAATDARPYVQPGRRKKVQIAVFFEKPVRKQLHQLCVDHETSVQQLMREAINDLFAKYRLPEIAE